MKVKRLVTLSFLLAMALALNLAEFLLLPAIGIPGIKFGLANIVILVILARFRFRDALFVTLTRVLLTSIIVGNFLQMGFFMSLAGGLLSLIVMAVVNKLFPKLSLITVSILGSAVHVTAQVLIAMFYLESSLIFYYLPFIGLASLVTGALVGVIAGQIIRTGIFDHLSCSSFKIKKKAGGGGSFPRPGSLIPR